MKISKKVANGMLIGGTIGALSGLGGVIYFNVQTDRSHPVEQKLDEMKETFNACAYNHDEASCQKWKQQYAGLETELAGLKNNSAYQQFMEDRDRNRVYSISSTAGVILMVSIMIAGNVIYGRRIKEECDEIWKIFETERYSILKIDQGNKQ